jgi:signal transduction histidine kinase
MISITQLISLKEKIHSSLFTIGIYPNQTSDQQRNIIVTNYVAIIFFLSAMLIGFLVYFGIDYFKPLWWIFPVLMILFLLPLPMNYWRYNLSSRILLSCIPSTVVLIFSVQAKLSINDITFNDYYNFRIALIALCTIPLLLFSLREKFALAVTSAYCFLTLFLSDRIHHLFNVGFYDIGFEDTHYDFINVNSVVASLTIMFCIISLKRIIEKQEIEKESLLAKLKISHHEVLAQRDELLAQGEKLHESQLQLIDAYEKIRSHKSSLEEELAVYHSEILQFSYNVCHHLKGPVASLSGLVNILTSDGGDKHNLLLPHFKKQVKSLNEVVSDLNYVLQLRRDLFHKRSSLSLTKVFWEVQSTRSEDISKAGVVVKIDFERAPIVYASKMALIGIFDNLLSNAIKFRDENTRPIVELSTYIDRTAGETVITFRDNGIGIDLDRFGEDLFKMYKTFHDHVEGKGLGLYLVKLQVEALGGRIHVESKVNEFTKFIIHLPAPKSDHHRFDDEMDFDGKTPTNSQLSPQFS